MGDTGLIMTGTELFDLDTLLARDDDGVYRVLDRICGPGELLELHRQLLVWAGAYRYEFGMDWSVNASTAARRVSMLWQDWTMPGGAASPVALDVGRDAVRRGVAAVLDVLCAYEQEAADEALGRAVRWADQLYMERANLRRKGR
ncbi:hypothetical protein D5S17_36100 [Pseudonocardiaceae bacterium YIM PH 21723]|nr:hypothetical protein D5S17_36100 [Pseudonocardiaceae bacterium YIM PH 21723]